jgi:hypothetical protein
MSKALPEIIFFFTDKIPQYKLGRKQVSYKKNRPSAMNFKKERDFTNPVQCKVQEKEILIDIAEGKHSLHGNKALKLDHKKYS